MTLKGLLGTVILKLLFTGGGGTEREVGFLPFHASHGPILIALLTVLFDGLGFVIYKQEQLSLQFDLWLESTNLPIFRRIIRKNTIEPPIFKIGIIGYLLVMHSIFGYFLYLVHGSSPKNRSTLILFCLLISLFKFSLLQRLPGGGEGGPISLSKLIFEECRIWIPAFIILFLSFVIQRALATT